MNVFKILSFSLVVFLVSCVDDTKTLKDDFNRSESLRFIAEDIIIPAWESYDLSTNSLAESFDQFKLNPSEENLNFLRQAFKNTWLTWQDVSIFEIGKAEELKVLNYTNIYPADTSRINSSILSGTYNLELPSTYDEQGFPTIDYLLYGIANSDESITETLNDEKYQSYLTSLINRLTYFSSEVLNDWKTNFKEEFIANNGSSASASYDKLVNDFLFYYEKHLRAGKVGIPAGVFSASKLPNKVEALYNRQLNKELFSRSLRSVENLFNGVSYDETTTGKSFSSYISHIKSLNDVDEIVTSINENWKNTREQLENIDDDFSQQVESDNLEMLKLFDALQKNVPLLKVDMLSQLSIQVDYVDADGD